jgi:hypothetical protein
VYDIFEVAIVVKKEKKCVLFDLSAVHLKPW